MKQILFSLLVLASVASFAQKKQKPNINKALKMMQDGDLAGAKAMIDDAAAFEKTMNDGKTWYYRGLIYAAIDTSKNDAVRQLSENPLQIALRSFSKADSLGKKGTEYFIQEPGNVVPVMKSTQMEMLANYYLDSGIKKFQDEQDNEASLSLLRKSKNVFENHIEKYPNDTLTYYVTALVAQQSDSLDLALSAAEKYIEKGGKSRDAYLIMLQIYNEGPKADKDKALATVRAAKKAFPMDADFPKYEIDMLIRLDRIDEARTELEEAIKKEPTNKILLLNLGLLNDKSGNVEAARKAYQDALKVDPAYYEAQFYYANTFLVPVDKVVKELASLSNTAKDAKRRQELLQERVKVSEAAVPHWEKTEKMKAPDQDTQIETLQKLSLLYYYTADDKNSARVAKELKRLGVED